MNTEWIIEAKCPQKEGSMLEETARSCTECPHKIPVLDAGKRGDVVDYVE
jgi:hypothetical protein